MVACNQDGSDKLPLLVIGKYARPRCLKNTNMDLLPVKYKSQKNAWMDNTLYEQWVREIDRRMKAAKRNILLIVDNCTAHVTVTYIHTYIHTLLTFPRGFSKTIHDPIYN